MPQARLPDINTSMITFRNKICKAIDDKEWTDMHGYLLALNGTLPPEYRVLISTIEYNKIAKEDTTYQCQSCHEQIPKEEIIVFDLLPSAMERLIYADESKKVWNCTKCRGSMPNDLTTTIISVSKLQNPSFLGVVPDAPQRKDGLMDRLKFDMQTKQWGLGTLAELEQKMAKFRDDHWNKGDNEDDMDIDTSTEESEQ